MRFPAVVLLSLASVLHADIIWLTSGKAVEGIAVQVNGKIRVIERDGKGEFELSTALVVRVDQGIWLQDLEHRERARVEQALRVTTVPQTAHLATRTHVLRNPLSWWRRQLASGPEARRQAYTLLVGAVGLVFFSLIAFSTYISVVVTAFRHHIGIGLIALLPPATMIYVLACYAGRRWRTLLALLSPGIWSLIVWFILRR